MIDDEPLSKAELQLIDRIVGALGLSALRTRLLSKVHQAFNFSFNRTQIAYDFVRASPDELALKYLEDRVFILSDKTRDRLTGDLRWQLLEGMRNTESVDEIKRRLDIVFEGNTVNTERIARTEVLNAMAEGRWQANIQSGIANYKQWRAAMKNARTAADSKRLHGQIQKIGDPFVDPKTGDECMHNPNRPNCRCTVLYLHKLPPIVRKNGQMYAVDEVGKIEIDIGSLQKGGKRVWVKATAKRKGHYRKIKGVKKVEAEVETKSAMDRLKSIIPDVRLDGATEDQLESITSGVEETFGGFPSVKVDSIGWSTSDDDFMYGMADAAYIPLKRHDRSRLIIRKEVATDIATWENKANRKFIGRKELNVDYFKDHIAGFNSWGESEIAAEYEEKLENLNACSRLFVALSQEDKLKSIMVHECYHAIGEQMKLESVFEDQLKKIGVTEKEKMTVSDYASSKDTELWAEVGSAIDGGMDIPDSIKQAFNATMETIR